MFFVRSIVTLKLCRSYLASCPRLPREYHRTDAFPADSDAPAPRHPALRGLVRETRSQPADLVYPMFVAPALDGREPIGSMPGIDQLSIAQRSRRRAGRRAGVRPCSCSAFPATRTTTGSRRVRRGGHRPAGGRARSRTPPPTARHHRRLPVRVHRATATAASCAPTASVDNDATLELLARTAVSHAQAGADMVAPSDMMDGRVGAIRAALDAEGFATSPIMAYAAKYASRVLRPVPRGRRLRARSSATAAATRWTRPTPREALRETALDIEEGADMVMVKPALAYLDVIRRVKDEIRPAARRLQRLRRVRDGQGGGRAPAGSTSSAPCSRR